MALNLTPEDEAEERELYASLYPTEGIAIDASGRAKNPKQQTLLDQQEEDDEED